MSEKLTPGCESSASLDPLQLALKKVYSVHKEKIKDLTEERDDFKEGCELLLQHKTRLLEKVRSLQNHNEVLYNENTRLRNLLDTVRSQNGRTGACPTCDHLQRSLSAIQEAYKHSLDEKEKMIHYLEERVAELTRQSSPFSKQPELNLSNLLTPDKSINEGELSRPGSSHGKSPSHKRGVQERDKQATTSKKILEVVTNRLGRESTQDVLDDHLTHQKEGYRKLSHERKEGGICDESSSYKKNTECNNGNTDNSETDQREVFVKSRKRNLKKTESARSQTDKCSTDRSESNRQVVSVQSVCQERNQESARSKGTLTETRPAGNGQSGGEKESPETLRQRRLGLGRNRGKRSRYTEDSPTGKKKTRFDTADVHNTSEEFDEPVQKAATSSSQQTKRLPVFVQETCPDSDRTVSMSSDGTPEKVQIARMSSAVEVNNADFGVVPETLGMGLTSSESDSDDDMNTQDTVRAKTENCSPRDVCSPPSDLECDAKLAKVNKLLNKSTNCQDDEWLKRKSTAGRGHHQNSYDHTDSVPKPAVDSDERKNRKSDICTENRLMTRPSSPVFSGVRGGRHSTESPFLFDDDAPGSNKSIRRSANMSGLTSDQESPLLLRPVDSAVRQINYGQSPAVSIRSRKSEEIGTIQSPRDEECTTEQQKTGKSSQDKLQRCLKIRKLRNNEKLKQTTLSQAFTPSPPSLPFVDLSPTKPEERAAIDKAIRLSLQEIDTNRSVVKSKKPLFGKHRDKVGEEDAAAENLPPLFKKPPSLNTLSPAKRRSPTKKSPHKLKLSKTSLSKCKNKHSEREDVVDLDETVPPDSVSLESMSKPAQSSQKDAAEKPQSVLPVNILNESLDPDVSLTQYCSDTELLTQRLGHRTRRLRGMKSASQSLDTGSSQDICTINGRKMELGKADHPDGLRVTTSSRTHKNSGKNQTSNLSQESNKGTPNKMASLDENTAPSTHRSSKRRARDTGHFTPNEGVSLEQDDTLAASGVSKPSSSVAILSRGPSQDVEEDDEADVTLNPKFMQAHMFEGQMEESQSIPLSSCSYKFGTTKSSKSGSSGEEKQENLEADICDEEEYTLTFDRQDDKRRSLSDSFDRVPQKEKASYAHVDVVRKRAERQQLKATTCQECYDYYKSKGCTEEEIHKQVQDCSRHRARYLPSSTPEHFWSIGFPDTQECEERGYIGVQSPSKMKPGHRRRRKLAKRFKSRQEEEGDESQTDTLS